MAAAQERVGLSGNRLLDRLPSADRGRLQQGLALERGEMKQVLLQAGTAIQSVYFPVDAVVSSLTTMSDGSGVEIATIGNEGMVGSPLFLGSTSMSEREFCQVQVPGMLLRMDATIFREEMAKRGAFQDVVQLYIQALFSQLTQQVACNGLHSINERCSRWLLLTLDRVGTDEFPMTQEFLSQMLGVRRASVTLAAGALQNAGFIRYRLGRITVLDREGVEATACECYRVLRDEFDRLLGTPPPRLRAAETPRP